MNPEGFATVYYFEYGPTTAYGSKKPLSPQDVGYGTANVSVSQILTGLNPAATYHYRVVASSPEGTTYGTDKTFKTTISMIPTLDPLNRTEVPLSNGGKWSALAWASGTATGQDTTAGWGPYNNAPTINGAYWNPTTFAEKSATRRRSR